MAAKLDIAVVGAGIAGLASAIMLARDGHRVTVYERFETPRPLGSGLMLQPPGLAALERLGLRDELTALGQPIRRFHGETATGRTIFDLAYDRIGPDMCAFAIHRAALHGALWRAFQVSGAGLEAGITVATIENGAGGRARLGDGKGRHLTKADLTIDASGARSLLRGWVANARRSRVFQYGAVWATVADIGIAPAMLAQRYVDARIMIGYLPLGRRETGGEKLAAFFWSLKPDDHPAWRAGFAAWRDRVVALWPDMAPVVESFGGPDELTLASYVHFTANRVSRDTVVLVGDAAHATSPQLGQGANHGIIDAVVLADAIAISPDLAAALALYARRRRRHVRFYQYASAVMTRFFQSDSVPLARLRDLTFDRMKLVPLMHRQMVLTLAGMKTGLLTHAAPERIVNGVSRPLA